jgi:Family of unknown function (DUF6261)
MKKLHNLKISALYHIEAGQLVKRNIEDLTKAGINLTFDPIVQNYVSQMTADTTQMDLALTQIRERQETQELEALDIKRDTSVRVLRMQLKIYASSNIPEELTAYNTLKIPFNVYKNIEKLNYEAENNAIDNFLDEIAKPMYASAIATLNLSNLIARMNADNIAFKNLFSARSIGIANTPNYNTKAIRKVMIANYESYASYVLSLTNATVNLPNNPYYISIYNIIDTIRKYFSDMLSRR